MKIIHAVWEKRNLGVDCYELRVEDKDSWDDVRKAAAETGGDYKVLRIPCGRGDIFPRVSEVGYSFIETQVSCYYFLGEERFISPIQKRLMENVRCEIMNEEDLQYCYGRIAGGLFTSERVAIDPAFSSEAAAKRFSGWISDELERGSLMYKYLYKDKVIGFAGVSEREDGDSYNFLGATYPEYQSKGFGQVTFLRLMEAAKKRGAKRMFTGFSMNNAGAANMHISMGCRIDKSEYVFVRHEKQGCGQ
ncbi:MAG: GNAT family N-acetyltransferase [Ruminiclostridium sp.]|nr:GNAT family N-acetyltransferase [Ruminiclostridium sp.]